MNVTPLYIALSALLVLFLAIRVIRLRWKHQVSIGTGHSQELERAVRAHANATEYLPIALLLFMSLEFMGVSGLYIHGLGIALIVGRLIHAYQISLQKPLILRMIGMGLTMTVIGLSAISVFCMMIF